MHIIAVNIDYYNVPWELGGNNKAGDSTHKLEAGADYINTSLDYALHQKMNDGKLKIIYSAGIGYSVEGYSFKTTTAPVGATTDVFGNEKFDENIKSFSAFYIPLGVAAEHQTWDTIKTRIGVRKNVFSTKSSEVKAASLTTKVNGQFWGGDELTLAMGLGWRPAEKVQFDLVANADAFNLTTFFTAISARYHY